MVIGTIIRGGGGGGARFIFAAGAGARSFLAAGAEATRARSLTHRGGPRKKHAQQKSTRNKKKARVPVHTAPRTPDAC